MIVIRFKVHCKPSRIEEALAAFADVVSPSRQLDGVVSFDIARDVLDPNTLLAIEVFENEAARARQEALPEVGRVMSLLSQIVEGPPEAMVFEVSSATDAFASS